MRTNRAQPLALLISDLHFSERAPIARSTEDWYRAMTRPINELKEVQRTYQVPIICAGDVFDRWDIRPQLINWLASILPIIHAIPGQHDLPFHRYSETYRSPFATLRNIGRIIELTPWKFHEVGDVLIVRGAPWGYKIPDEVPPKGKFCLAVLHRYVWLDQKSKHPQAKADTHIGSLKQELKHFQAAVTGDNHRQFSGYVGKCHVWNPGSFMRRTINQKEHKPAIGILYSTGEITPHFLDCSADKWNDSANLAKILHDNVDLASLGDEFSNLGHTLVNFIETLQQALVNPNINKRVRGIIRELIEEYNH